MRRAASALAKNGRNFGSDSSWPSTLVRISTPFNFRLAHDVFELAHRELRLLQRDHAEADEPVRLARAIFDDAVIGDPVGRFGDFRIDRIVALTRRWRHDLDIDAHPGRDRTVGDRSWS